MDKKELRAAMKRRNLDLTPQTRVEASKRLFAAVERLPIFVEAKTVGLFCALGDEPLTDQVLAAWSARKRVVVPRVEGEVMHFYEYDPATMGIGAFGIAEPGPAAVRCDPGQIDLIVVPGTVFTASGARMGRGRGYYDKYLSQSGVKAAKVGVCYAHQVVGELAVEPHDVAMDCVICG